MQPGLKTPTGNTSHKQSEGEAVEETTEALVIKKYAKISDPVSAVQFTGDNAEALVAWVRSQDRGARYEVAREAWVSASGKEGVPAVPAHIVLQTPQALKDVEVGMWIYQDEKGDFRTATDEAFNSKYVAA